MRRSVLAVSSLMVVAACSSSSSGDSTDYPGDPLAAIQTECEFRFAHKGCDGQCVQDALNMTCPGGDGFESEPNLSSYFDCRDQCPVTKNCSGGEMITLWDCSCTRDCAAKILSKHTQGMLAYEGDCYRALPRCQ